MFSSFSPFDMNISLLIRILSIIVFACSLISSSFVWYPIRAETGNSPSAPIFSRSGKPYESFCALTAEAKSPCRYPPLQLLVEYHRLYRVNEHERRPPRQQPDRVRVVLRIPREVSMTVRSPLRYLGKYATRLPEVQLSFSLSSPR